MAISARNVWPATVENLETGPVSTEVSLRLENGDPAVSTITTGSAERLGLAAGSRLQVLVKASHDVARRQRSSESGRGSL